MPCVYADLFPFGIGRRASGEPIVNSPVMGELATRALGKKAFSVRLVDMVKGFVGTLPVLGGHSLVDIAGDFLVALHEIKVLARFVFPGIAVMLG